MLHLIRLSESHVIVAMMQHAEFHANCMKMFLGNWRNNYFIEKNIRLRSTFNNTEMFLFYLICLLFYLALFNVKKYILIDSYHVTMYRGDSNVLPGFIAVSLTINF